MCRRWEHIGLERGVRELNAAFNCTIMTSGELVGVQEPACEGRTMVRGCLNLGAENGRVGALLTRLGGASGAIARPNQATTTV